MLFKCLMLSELKLLVLKLSFGPSKSQQSSDAKSYMSWVMQQVM